MKLHPFTLWTPTEQDREAIRQRGPHDAGVRYLDAAPLEWATMPAPRPPHPRNPALVLMASPPIPWGKPDAELAKGVRASMDKANPATVIPWAPGQGRLHARLRTMKLHPDIDDAHPTHTHRFIPIEDLLP